MRQPNGQNFLTDTNIARKIISAAGLSSSCNVVEIGPGKGALTRLIAPVVKSFTAIEIDNNLYDKLTIEFKDFKNTRFINSDFLKYPFADEAGPLKIVANLPYNVSTAIIEKFLPENNWTTAVLMVQKEVGERLSACSGSRDHGYFSSFCGYYAKVVKLFSVGPGCFFPKPKVDSSVMLFTNLFSPPLEAGFINFLKAAFSQRRKTAPNSISSSLKMPKNEVLKAFELSGIDPALRPENLHISQFQLLYKTLNIS